MSIFHGSRHPDALDHGAGAQRRRLRVHGARGGRPGRRLCAVARNDRRHGARRRGAPKDIQARGRRPDRRGGEAPVGRTAHPPACRLDGNPARRRQGGQPCAAVLAGRARCLPATTRSTCSTSISTMAKAGANPRPTSRAAKPSSPISASARLGFAVCYDVRFPQLFRAEAHGRRRGADRACRLHAADRRGALARAAEGARHRERRLPDRRRAGRPARGRPRNLRPFDDRRSVGQGARRGGARRARRHRRRDRHRPVGRRRGARFPTSGTPATFRSPSPASRRPSCEVQLRDPLFAVMRTGSRFRGLVSQQ